MVGYFGDAVQKVAAEAGLSVPIFHFDQFASAIVEIGCTPGIVVVDCIDQVDRAVAVFGNIAILICLADQVAVLIIDKYFSVAFCIDLGFYQSTIVIGIEGILPLIYLMDGIYPVHGDPGKSVHRIISIMTLGSGCIRYGNDISIAIHGVPGGIAVPVGYRCDLAVLIIAEGLGIAFRVGLGYRAVQGIILVSIGIAVPVGQGDHIVVLVVGVSLGIAQTIGIFDQVALLIILIGAADTVFVRICSNAVHRIIFQQAAVIVSVLDLHTSAFGIIGVAGDSSVLIDHAGHMSQGIVFSGHYPTLFICRGSDAVQGIINGCFAVAAAVSNLDQIAVFIILIRSGVTFSVCIGCYLVIQIIGVAFHTAIRIVDPGEIAIFVIYISGNITVSIRCR